MFALYVSALKQIGQY